MAETIGTITSIIYPYNSDNTAITTNAVAGIARFNRFKIVVTVDKASYDSQLATDGKPGSFDTNFVNFGLRASNTAPQTSSVYDLNKKFDYSVQDTATEYIITYNVEADKDWVLYPQYYAILNLRFLVNGVTENVFYQNVFYANTDAGNIANVKVLDASLNEPLAIPAGSADLDLTYDTNAAYDYHYVRFPELEYQDTFANAEFTFQNSSVVTPIADGSATIPTPTEARSAVSLVIVETLKTPTAAATCDPFIALDTTWTYIAENGNDADISISYDMPALTAGDITSFTIEQVETLAGYGNSTSVAPNGSLGSTAWKPDPDDPAYETKYEINLLLTNGCSYSGEIIFLLANYDPFDSVVQTINLTP